MDMTKLIVTFRNFVDVPIENQIQLPSNRSIKMVLKMTQIKE